MVGDNGVYCEQQGSCSNKDFNLWQTIKRVKNSVMGHLNTNNFIFLFFYFPDFILILFSHFFYFSFGR